MKILLTKNKNINSISQKTKIIELLSTEINNDIIHYIQDDEIPFIKFTDTNELYLIKNISSRIGNSFSDVLIEITENDLVSLSGIGNTDSRPYKVYTALLTQNGTNAPTAIVLENELTNVVLLYDSVGFYKITFDEYIANKVLIFSGHSIYGNSGEIVKCSVNNYAPFGASIFSLGSAGSPINGYIKDMPIEIRVYN